MKTRKLIKYSAIFNLLAVIIIIALSISIHTNKSHEDLFLLGIIGLLVYLILVSSFIISSSIKGSLWFNTYDNLIEKTEEAKKEWKTANNLIKILGEHEAVKLYRKIHPSNDWKTLAQEITAIIEKYNIPSKRSTTLRTAMSLEILDLFKQKNLLEEENKEEVVDDKTEGSVS